MIDVYFYNITKRLNSTATPSGTAVKIECVFKENTSLLNPVLKLRLSTKPDYNYFKIDDRYYWISDITSLNKDLWQIAGRVDVLATYKGHIQNTSAFVLYDSTANTQLPDNRLAIETDVKTYTSTATMPWNFRSGDGTYIIATTGNTDELDLLSLQTVPGDRVGTGVYCIPYDQLDNLGFDVSDWVTAFTSIFNTFSTRQGQIQTQYFTPGSDFIQNISNFILGWAYMTENLWNYVTKALRLFAGNFLGSGSALSNIKASYWLPFEIPSSATHIRLTFQTPHTLHWVIIRTS